MTTFHFPDSVVEAVALLDEFGADAAPVAGATWMMRAEQRGERRPRHAVALRRVPGLADISVGPDSLQVGALATHADLASAVPSHGPFAALGEAARRSAFPAIRNTATLGGNLAATPFPEADLVPALLATDATVVLASPAGERRVGVEAFLRERDERPGEVILGVAVPAIAGRRSAYVRQTVRAGAEYPLASVAVSLDLDDARVVRDARVAVGSIEPLARRVVAAEDALRGQPLEARLGAVAAAAAAATLDARDGLDAPGWYRLEILPHLLTRALTHVMEG